VKGCCGHGNEPLGSVKTLGRFWLAEKLVASQRLLSSKLLSTEQVSALNMNSNLYIHHHVDYKNTPWPLVSKRTIPTKRPPLVCEVSANFCR
jgi:hypothetical protein